MSRENEPAPLADRPILGEADGAFDRLPAEPGGVSSHLAQLGSAWRQGRLPHALLLQGPRGSGKRHAAVRLAQWLACAKAGDGGPCLSCVACTRVARGLDPDVIVLEPVMDEKRRTMRGEITVEQVRRLQDMLSVRAAGSRRFVLVDPADRLSLVAQEAVLKTLEEPPPGVTIALVTSRPSALKPTVRSRCQVLRFAAPSRAALRSVLTAGAGRTDEQADLASELSGGDLRRALALDPEVSAARWLDLARSLYVLLGPRGEGKARELALAAVPRKRASDDDERDDEETEGAEVGVPAWLDLLERILRDVMRAGVRGPGGAAGTTHAGGEKAIEALATRLSPDAAAAALLAVGEARADLQLHSNAKVVLTHMLLTIHGRREGAPRPLPGTLLAR